VQGSSALPVYRDATYGSRALNASLSVSPYSKSAIDTQALEGAHFSRRLPSVSKWPDSLMC
jgi:hypothetical protein